MSHHVADKNEPMVICNIPPDFCRVAGAVVPFEIFQLVSSELTDYSPDVFAHKGRVLKVGSIVRGTNGNMGVGVFSGVSLSAGHAVVLTGEATVTVNGVPTARHTDFAMMNIT